MVPPVKKYSLQNYWREYFKEILSLLSGM